VTTPPPSDSRPPPSAPSRAGAAAARDAAQAALRWRPDSLAKQHVLALFVALVLPAVLRLVTTLPPPGEGLLVFVTIVLGFGCVLGGVALYLWWTALPWQHRDDESYAPPWRFGAGPTALSRHPGWLAVIAMVLGQALLTPSWILWGYALAVIVGLNLLVRRFDEPGLQRQAGAEYDDYAERVPRWLPWQRMRQTLREIGQMLRDTVRSR
jgi:protein-S-isoprenylcysteine O-methyltransferase Ste14